MAGSEKKEDKKISGIQKLLQEEADKSTSVENAERETLLSKTRSSSDVSPFSTDNKELCPLKCDPFWCLENITEASKNARRIYFILVAFLAFCAITVISTSDRQIIFNETARLPILDLEIPLNGFFIFGPLLAISLFIYFQLYLLKIKDLKSYLDKKCRAVKKRWIYPWMVNIAEDEEEGLIGKLQRSTVKISIWWMLPIVLILFAIWTVKTHEPVLFYIVGIFPLVGTAIVIFFWWKYKPKKKVGKYSLAIFVSVFEIIFFFLMIPSAQDGTPKLPWTEKEISLSGNYLGFQKTISKFVKKWTTVDLSYQKLITEPKHDYPHLYWGRFRGARLEGAQLTCVILKRAELADSCLKRANLRSANLEGANLDNADLRQADLRLSNLNNASLLNADLQDARLTRVKLNKAKLFEANLQGAILIRANLNNSLFANANLEGADLGFSNLHNARLQKAIFRGANLSAANLEGADLKEASIEEADLTLSNLNNASLTKANLNRAVLKEANLKEANLEKADLTLSNLSNTSLVEANLKEANLKEANLKEANLSGADLQGALGLKLEQLAETLSLFDAKLDSDLLADIKSKYPHLLRLRNQKNKIR